MIARMHNHSCWIDGLDTTTLKMYFDDKLTQAGFTVLRFVDYHFEPYGYTAIWLLGESHFAIHTFPEADTTYIELSSCVRDPFDKFLGSVINDR
jgi:S-adenosylmethionine decarboxylase